MLVVRLLSVLALVALNGFFAATEFSLVAVRLSRVRQLVASGNARARVVELLLGDLHRVVSGVQLGITLASLSLGALGESTLAKIFQGIWPGTAGARTAIIAHAIALASAFALLSALHVVIGELVPKTLSLARAERVALLVALPFHWFLNTFHWAINLLDGVSSAIVKALGVSSPKAHGDAHSTEELQIQIQQARERGLLAVGEEKFILSALELAQIQVREIMVPRPDMHTLPIESNLDEVMRAFATTQRSRIPVYRGTQDHILGFVHIKDMMWILLDRERRVEENLLPPPFDLRRVLREVLLVPETKPASELLLELRTRRVGMAVVVDEFGSILGLVTMEDVLEQMVGEIHDEFDVIERPLTLADGALIFDAALNVRDLDAQYNITLPEDPAYATVGGFVLDQLGFIPKGGESFEFGDYRFSVVEMDGKRVARVKIQHVRGSGLKAPESTGSVLQSAKTPATPRGTS
jgi:CBS domain containing-hemolysin-like protein